MGHGRDDVGEAFVVGDGGATRVDLAPVAVDEALVVGDGGFTFFPTCGAAPDRAALYWCL